MNPPVTLATIYLAQLWAKAALALLCRARERPPASVALSRLTILQPVTSGDETLGPTLRATVTELCDSPLIWIIDRTDGIARTLCESMVREFPDRSIRIVEADEPPAGTNPKLWKQAVALPLVQTELLAIMDDDTRASRKSVSLLVSNLDDGAAIVTGLPCYVAAPGPWSQLLAEFVNSAAILTYLPAAACAAPRSINGMCYAVRTDYARRTQLFTATSRAITDDLAVARQIIHLGGRIVQTTQPQFITTSVGSATHYWRLMHRWFVFTRILVQHESPVVQSLILVVYGIHPLLLIALTLFACTGTWSAIWPLVIVLGLRSATLALLNRTFTGAWRHSPLASVLSECLQPVFLLSACCHPVIWWRQRKIRVLGFNHFEYLSS